MNKPVAVIFDLDGTLADLNGRSPYGETLRADCPNDLCIESIAHIARLYAAKSSVKIIVVSGRNEVATFETKDWLKKHGIVWDHLFMRKDRDYRPDEIVKEEIYREKIEPYYDVEIVFDDRPKVIRMWRNIGLKVADVGKGIEF